MLSKEEVLHLLNEAKKEVDRLETNRQVLFHKLPLEIRHVGAVIHFQYS